MWITRCEAQVLPFQYHRPKLSGRYSPKMSSSTACMSVLFLVALAPHLTIETEVNGLERASSKIAYRQQATYQNFVLDPHPIPVQHRHTRNERAFNLLPAPLHSCHQSRDRIPIYLDVDLASNPAPETHQRQSSHAVQSQLSSLVIYHSKLEITSTPASAILSTRDISFNSTMLGRPDRKQNFDFFEPIPSTRTSCQGAEWRNQNSLSFRSFPANYGWRIGNLQ